MRFLHYVRDNMKCHKFEILENWIVDLSKKMSTFSANESSSFCVFGYVNLILLWYCRQITPKTTFSNILLKSIFLNILFKIETIKTVIIPCNRPHVRNNFEKKVLRRHLLTRLHGRRKSYYARVVAHTVVPEYWQQRFFLAKPLLSGAKRKANSHHRWPALTFSHLKTGRVITAQNEVRSQPIFTHVRASKWRTNTFLLVNWIGILPVS